MANETKPYGPYAIEARRSDLAGWILMATKDKHRFLWPQDADGVVNPLGKPPTKTDVLALEAYLNGGEWPPVDAERLWTWADWKVPEPVVMKTQSEIVALEKLTLALHDEAHATDGMGVDWYEPDMPDGWEAQLDAIRERHR